MKNKLPILPSAAIMAALLLASCGKQEAVGDVPSSEELAKQADAASAAIREAADAADGKEAEVVAPALTSYTNALRGFTILLPKGWELDKAASDDNGRVYANDKATLKVGWVENREDADIKAAVAAVDAAGEEMSGSYVSDDDYRAEGTEDDQKTMLRIMRKPDGTMVSAKMTYPADQSETLDAIGKRILDSLTLK